MIKHVLRFSFLLVVIFAGCSQSHKKGISEGTIEFDAVAVDKNNSLADMAPKTLLVKIKDGKSYAEMSSAMGLLTVVYISDYEAKTLTQLVKVVYKKHICIQQADELDKAIAASPKPKVQFTSDTKVIAGYKCKKAIISYDDPKMPKFDVFYTDEIAIEKPNWFNEFREIDGVLLEYQLKRYNIELRFTAKTITPGPISDDTFKVPDDDYRKVSQKELEDIFSNLQ